MERTGGSVNVTEELNELLQIYEGTEKDMLEQEKRSLETLEVFMSQYLRAKNERCIVTKRVEILRGKLGLDDEQDEEE